MGIDAAIIKKDKKKEHLAPAPWYQPHPSLTPVITPLVIQPPLL
jgi:hypothetical protein